MLGEIAKHQERGREQELMEHPQAPEFIHLTQEEAETLARKSELTIRDMTKGGAYMDDWRLNRVNVRYDADGRIVSAEIF